MGLFLVNHKLWGKKTIAINSFVFIFFFFGSTSSWCEAIDSLRIAESSFILIAYKGAQ